MGRTANPIPAPDSAAGKLAALLRGGLARKGIGYRKLAERTRYHPTTLQRAASGMGVPSWPVVKIFASGCDLDQEEAHKCWEAARREKALREQVRPLGEDPPRAVGVTQVVNYAELGVVLAALRTKKGSPPYRLMQRRANATELQFGPLPRSTGWRIVHRTTQPSLQQMRAFLVGCDVPPDRHGPYLRAWERAHTQQRRDLAKEHSKTAAPDNPRRLDPYQVVRKLGYVPREPFRSIHSPWTVACALCGEDVRRIRLSQVVAGLAPATCPRCDRTLQEAPADCR
ncbi:helix-turn-helix domain-containing protein [Streptomyces sp. NPDC056944]|uniref:helix-turn-helix domain-containing protein n=1 Tax=unclassified Streptomyces TaxID=2593676 RepID=UPI003638A0BA